MLGGFFSFFFCFWSFFFPPWRTYEACLYYILVYFPEYISDEIHEFWHLPAHWVKFWQMKILVYIHTHTAYMALWRWNEEQTCQSFSHSNQTFLTIFGQKMHYISKLCSFSTNLDAKIRNYMFYPRKHCINIHFVVVTPVSPKCKSDFECCPTCT